MNSTEFFSVELPILNCPLIWQGNTFLGKIITTISTPLIIIHELGHALAGVYYNKLNLKEIVFESGGGTTYFVVDTEEKIVDVIFAAREMIAAGPLTSATVNTIGLCCLAGKSKKFTLLNGVQAYYHLWVILNEVYYAIISSWKRDNGDWGLLAKYHPKTWLISGIALSALSLVSYVAFIRCIENYLYPEESSDELLPVSFSE